MSINKQDLTQWIKDQEYRYASKTVKRSDDSNETDFLVFSVGLYENYIVRLSDEVIYDGFDIDLAISIYNKKANN